jgi:hypothetical protein
VADLLGYECYVKTPGGDTWTPVKASNIGSTLAEKFKALVQLNKHKIKGVTKTFDLSHPKYGMDINIRYDADAAGAARHDAQKEEKTALTDEEKAYLLQDIKIVDKLIPSEEESRERWDAVKDRVVYRNKENKWVLLLGDSKKKKKKDEDDEEEIIDLEDSDYLSDDDEKPKKKKKKKVKKEADSAPFDLDSIDLDDLDFDEKPKKKKKKVRK